MFQPLLCGMQRTVKTKKVSSIMKFFCQGKRFFGRILCKHDFPTPVSNSVVADVKQGLFEQLEGIERT